MKKIYKILSILWISLIAVSCSDFLEEAPIDTPSSSTFFKTEQQAISAVTAVYAALTRGERLFGREMITTELLSDNCWHSNATNDSFGNFNLFTFTSESEEVRGFYEALYQGINRANLAINAIPGIEMNESLQSRLVAEAQYLRGYFYFLLTLFYADVPIILQSSEDPKGFQMEKSPAREVYEQAIADISTASGKLPLNYPDEEFGRITSGTAKAMLAKVYLFGADELGINEWYANAEQLAEEVIATNEYQLIDTDNPFDDFKSLFTMENEKNDEVIFSINHQAAGGGFGEPNATQIVIASEPRQSRGTIWGWGWTYIYKEVGEPSYWEEGDARREVSIWGTGDDMAPQAPDKIFDMATQLRAILRPGHYAMRKYAWTHPERDRAPSSAYNFPAMRYSDLLLIHAEASLKNNGIDAAALTSYNAVRDRAGLSPVASFTEDEVLKQRQYEFIGECHRWFDLVRTRSAESAFSKITSVSDRVGFNPSRHYKLPLPQQAINLNAALVQNPNW